MKQILPLFLLLLAPMLVSADLITIGSSLDATLLYYEPAPAQPGDVIDVWIQIENDGAGASKPGTATILDSGALIPVNDAQRVREFPSIPGRENFLFKVELRIAKDVSEGDNTLTLRIQEMGSSNYIERDLPVSVVGTTSTLAIVETKTTPAEILPGETATLEITVRNIGETLVRNVDVSLDLTELDLAPTGNSNSKTISSLAGGSQHTFTFELTSFPTAVAKAHRIPVTLGYDDEQGNAKSQEESVGMVIGAKPELLIYFEDVGVSDATLSGPVVIRFVNRGLSEIKLLQFEVLENDDIEVLSESPVVYVGNIDEDDYESAQVTLGVSSASENTVPIRVIYKDALNRQYDETLQLTLKPQAMATNGGLSPLVWIIVIVVIAGIVWWFFRRRK